MSVTEGWDTGIGAALASLKPGAEWSISGQGVYSEIVWLEKPVYEGGQAKPTEDEVNKHIDEGMKAFDQNDDGSVTREEYKTGL